MLVSHNICQVSTYAGVCFWAPFFTCSFVLFCVNATSVTIALKHDLVSSKMNPPSLFFLSKKENLTYIFTLPRLILELVYRVTQKKFCWDIYRFIWEELIPVKYWVFLPVNKVYLLSWPKSSFGHNHKMVLVVLSCL